MMMRTFKLWRSVFSGADTTRLVRVAAVQHSWYDNTRRVLGFLFQPGNGGCDAVSPAGYFNFEKANHDAWNAMPPSQVTPQMIIRAVDSIYDFTSGKWTRETAKYANQYRVDYIVYEGGQHMQPFQQGEWGYNQSVWNAQIHPAMYDLYMKNFRCHVEPAVNCKLFAAFSYVGTRESRWGSWGHLENYDQLRSMSTIETAAPKYQALLDANTAKTGGTTGLPGREESISRAALRPSFTRAVLAGSSPIPGRSDSRIAVYRVDGTRVAVSTTPRALGRRLGAGIYLLRTIERPEGRR